VSRLEVAYADRAVAILQQSPYPAPGANVPPIYLRGVLRGLRWPGREPGVPVS
jgi:hypothetical protein